MTRFTSPMVTGSPARSGFLEDGDGQLVRRGPNPSAEVARIRQVGRPHLILGWGASARDFKTPLAARRFLVGEVFVQGVIDMGESGLTRLVRACVQRCQPPSTIQDLEGVEAPYPDVLTGTQGSG
jgi:hypothetical protein